MGRREEPIDPAAQPALEDVALLLRRQRAKARLTYRELAARTDLSAATLQRAASGTRLPREKTATAFMKACGATDLEMASVRWALRRARRELHSPGAIKPNPDLINDKSDLSVALAALWRYAGGPSLREMQRKAGGSPFLPISSASRTLRREALPASREQAAAFLRACDVAPQHQDDWLEAWDKVVSTRRRRTTPPSVKALIKDVEALLPTLTGQEAAQLTTLLTKRLSTAVEAAVHTYTCTAC